MNKLIIWGPGMSMSEVEEQIIKSAIEHYRGNKTMTAKSLGLSVKTIDDRLRTYQQKEELNKRQDEEYKKRLEDNVNKARGLKQAMDGSWILCESGQPIVEASKKL